MDLTVDKRERLVQLLTSEYTVPEEYIDCVMAAVRQFATKNYSDEVIEKMVRTPQSLSKGLALLRERNGKNDLSLFRGIIAEWFVCAEYNALKNKGTVIMTITNPDPSSKADLLHIINTGEGFKAVPGPDVKSGGSTYIFNQWKKIVNERYEIPMVDIEGILTTEEGLKQLTKKQQTEFDELCIQFPSKRPLDTSFDKSDINRVMADYLKFVEFDLLPSAESELSVQDINTTKIKEKLYSGIVSNGQSYDWMAYAKESKNIFNEEVSTGTSENNTTKVEKDSDSKEKASFVVSYQPVNKKKGLLKFISPTAVNTSKKVAIGIGHGFKKIGKATLKFVDENPEFVEAAVAIIAVALSSNNESRDISKSNKGDYYYGDEAKSYDDEYYADFENTSVSKKSSLASDEKIGEPLKDEDTFIEVNSFSDEALKNREAHASKHIRKLREGQKASPEKIATAKENGFDLAPGETWVKDY
ncbi:hypothetical protein [Streptococcus sp. CSL10205-OR2]|uniref:hypothetical protein n=1 Tax=Streptococcus sp. CSL10205-OR2 TaxID=2980558 RepID=UPI0021D8654E|nr:hypothetical protein [Streptococcus sp. CSL10205-OR2]MCU9533552.1 hypothetical protein [Streptococcus sp. CSL10205-OR2]